MSDTLKLEDLAPDRLTIELPDGGTVEMLDPRELSFYDRAELARLVQRLAASQDDVETELSPERVEKLEKVLRELVARILPNADPGVVENMAPLHLDQVSGAFLGRYGRMIETIAAGMEPTKNPGIRAG